MSETCIIFYSNGFRSLQEAAALVFPTTATSFFQVPTPAPGAIVGLEARCGAAGYLGLETEVSGLGGVSLNGPPENSLS